MDVYLVRHGATDSNLGEGAYAGWRDLELAPLGVAQARRTADRLRGLRLGRVLCSDLRRAVQTAEIIARPHDLVPEIVPAWRELNYGEWDGLTAQQVEQRWPGALQRLSEDADYPVPGGETLSEVLARVLPALEALVPSAGEGADRDVVVVSHKATIRVLLCHLMGLPIIRYKHVGQANCAVNRLVLQEGAFSVAGVNLTDHLES
jgi:broad specificity phosphatase PhoE